MGSIYEKASAVLMWLGETSDDSNLAFDLLEVMFVASKLNTIAQLASLLETSYDRCWRILNELLLNRKYWYPAWILQEVLLPRVAFIACGLRVASWELSW